MKTRIHAALIAASAVLLAACASHGGMRDRGPEAYQPTERVVDDVAYVATVERVARRRGVTVHWFNPPTKRVAGEARTAGSQ